MLEECAKKTLPNYKGIYARGSPSQVPPDHFVDSLNLSHNEPGCFGIRSGSSLYTTLAGSGVVDVCNWVDISGNVHLVHFTGDGSIYVDNVYNSTFGMTIVRVAAANFMGRLFMCPIQPAGASNAAYLSQLYMNGTTPTFKLAGGLAPTQTAQMTATDVASGGIGATPSTATGNPEGVTQQTNPQLGTTQGWFNTQNALTSTGYTTSTLYGNAGANYSNILIFTNFGFAIPAGSTITGVGVSLTHQQTGGTSSVYDAAVNIVGLASTVGKSNGTAWAIGSEETFSPYGGNGDLWGLTSISPAEINSSSFGFSIMCECDITSGGSGALIQEYQPTITIYYNVISQGNVSGGTTWAFDVSYETDTGFFTPPAKYPSTIGIQHTVGPNSSGIQLSNIPIGPPGTTGRLILAAPVIGGVVGAWNFVPTTDINPRVDNNNTVTTTLLNFYQTDLIESADYLFNLRGNIPSGQVIEVYSGRLVLGNFLYDSPPDRTSLRVSQAGDPETFDQTLETIIVEKDDGYNISNLAIIRDVLYIWKTKGIYAIFDNETDPVNWGTPSVVDQGFGAGLYGLSTISPTVTRASHSALVIGADIPGLYLFNGVVYEPEISYKIKDLWDKSVGDASQINIVGDVSVKRIFVFGFPQGPLQNLTLVGDYTEGITQDAIKWDVWTYHNNERVIENVPPPPVLSTSTPLTQVVTIVGNNLIKPDPTLQTDYLSVPINHYAVLGGQDFDEGVTLFRALRMKAIGAGILHISVAGEDSSINNPQQINTEELFSPILLSTPRREYQSNSKFMSERGYFKFECQPVNSKLLIDTEAYFNISKIVLYGLSVYAERPA